jgi:hypothetical protein
VTFTEYKRDWLSLKVINWARCGKHIPVFPILMSWRQKDLEFKASLGYIQRFSLKRKQINKADE